MLNQTAAALSALGTLTHALTSSNTRSVDPTDIFPPYHPDDMPRLYALICDGRDMEPAFMDGQTLLFAKCEPWRAGDFVAAFRRPNAVPPGENPILLKRLVSAPPASFFQQQERTVGIHGRLKGTAQTKVILRQMNPDRSVILKAEDVLGIHMCFGVEYWL